jgi:hypothetical protein
MNTLDNVFNSRINYFNYIKYKYYIYFECYKLDNEKNDFRYKIDFSKKYPIICLIYCILDNIIRVGYYLISTYKIIKIKYKNIFYNKLSIGSIITIKKFIFDIIKTNNIFDNYYELNKDNINLFDSEKKDAYIKHKFIK